MLPLSPSQFHLNVIAEHILYCSVLYIDSVLHTNKAFVIIWQIRKNRFFHFEMQSSEPMIIFYYSVLIKKPSRPCHSHFVQMIYTKCFCYCQNSCWRLYVICKKNANICEHSLLYTSFYNPDRRISFPYPFYLHTSEMSQNKKNTEKRNNARWHHYK